MAVWITCLLWGHNPQGERLFWELCSYFLIYVSIVKKYFCTVLIDCDFPPEVAANSLKHRQNLFLVDAWLDAWLSSISQESVRTCQTHRFKMARVKTPRDLAEKKNYEGSFKHLNHHIKAILFGWGGGRCMNSCLSFFILRCDWGHESWNFSNLIHFNPESVVLHIPHGPTDGDCGEPRWQAEKSSRVISSDSGG